MVVAWVLLCSFSGVLAGECKVLQNDSYLQYVVQSHTLPRAFSNFWRTLYFAFWMLLLTLLIHDGSLAIKTLLVNQLGFVADDQLDQHQTKINHFLSVPHTRVYSPSLYGVFLSLSQAAFSVITFSPSRL